MSLLGYHLTHIFENAGTEIDIDSLIGAIARKLGLVKFYFGMLIVHLLFSMGTGGYAIYRIFRDSPAYIDRCIGHHGGTYASKVCHDGATVTKAVVIGLFVLLWLIEICKDVSSGLDFILLTL